MSAFARTLDEDRTLRVRAPLRLDMQNSSQGVILPSHGSKRRTPTRDRCAPTNNLATAKEELRMKKLLLTLVAVAATLLFSAGLYADDYPSRPITIVNVFGPGSGSDTIGRSIADKLSPVLGQPLLAVDRPGAGGALAPLYAHHHPADRHSR